MKPLKLELPTMRLFPCKARLRFALPVAGQTKTSHTFPSSKVTYRFGAMYEFPEPFIIFKAGLFLTFHFSTPVLGETSFCKLRKRTPLSRTGTRSLYLAVMKPIPRTRWSVMRLFSGPYLLASAWRWRSTLDGVYRFVDIDEVAELNSAAPKEIDFNPKGERKKRAEVVPGTSGPNA